MGTIERRARDERRRKQRKRVQASGQRVRGAGSRRQPCAETTRNSAVEQVIHEMQEVARGRGIVRSEVLAWSPAGEGRPFATLTVRLEVFGLSSTITGRISLLTPEMILEGEEDCPEDWSRSQWFDDRVEVILRILDAAVRERHVAQNLLLARQMIYLEDLGIYETSLQETILTRLGLPASALDDDSEILEDVAQQFSGAVKKFWCDAIDRDWDCIGWVIEEAIDQSSQGTLDEFHSKVDSRIRDRLTAAARSA